MEEKQTAFCRSMGRPFYDTPDQLLAAVEAYFETVGVAEWQTDPKTGDILRDQKGRPLSKTRPPTLTGLTLFLGYASIQSMHDLVLGRGERFSEVVAYARTRIVQWHEEGLSTSSVTSGHIFAMTNIGKADWKDGKQIEHTGENGGPIQTIKRVVVDAGSILSGPSGGRMKTIEADVVPSPVPRETSRVSASTQEGQ